MGTHHQESDAGLLNDHPLPVTVVNSTHRHDPVNCLAVGLIIGGAIATLAFSIGVMVGASV